VIVVMTERSRRDVRNGNKTASEPKPVLTRRYNPGEHRPANATVASCDTRFAAIELFAIRLVLRFIDAGTNLVKNSV
jgi:hypothetical protein